MERVVGAFNRAANSNAVVNTFLAGIFGALAVRSWGQQRVVEKLEEEKESLLTANKAIKNTTWEWKQKLYAEAQQNALVPLARLKAIYGEAADPGEDDKEEAGAAAAAAARIMV
ncbi:hypothetical protein M569_00775 [Genlisea aurea]|uniref:Uncharacterized protein n=1 Tax=Genlisea aurea TaxID=192259 RepID=S8D3N2_9LAMI|nr:hypothetical protein M569_00775 [Genlisea aurea]